VRLPAMPWERRLAATGRWASRRARFASPGRAEAALPGSAFRSSQHESGHGLWIWCLRPPRIDRRAGRLYPGAALTSGAPRPSGWRGETGSRCHPRSGPGRRCPRNGRRVKVRPSATVSGPVPAWEGAAPGVSMGTPLASPETGLRSCHGVAVGDGRHGPDPRSGVLPCARARLRPVPPTFPRGPQGLRDAAFLKQPAHG
jgi:hypothetical protein